MSHDIEFQTTRFDRYLLYYQGNIFMLRVLNKTYVFIIKLKDFTEIALK